MIITRTPLRISFTGGGTDLRAYYARHGGAVVSTAIDKYIYITVNKKFDDDIRVSYSKTEIVHEPKELQHDIVRECLKMTCITGGVEITTIADIPAGTGLGSSSTFTVGLLNALYTYTGVALSAKELAEKACEVEIEKLGHPIGKQDQYAAAFGGLNLFQFNQDESVQRSRIHLPEIDMINMNRKLMLFYTGVKRSANDILEEQKNKTASRIDTLDFMKNQALEMYEDLSKHGFNETFATRLHAGWLKKKSLISAISSGRIDEMYKKALQAGAKGGKLLGAGGGGFILLYCDEDKQQAVRDALGLKEVDFRMSEHGSRVVYFA